METLVKTKWAVDPMHSELGFRVKHMMISTVSGYFENFEVNVKSENKDFKDADIEVRIRVNSINTGEKDRDAHLKSDDFFNAENYPEIVFVSKAYDGLKLIGDLTIRDITRKVELNVEYNGTVLDPYGQTKAGFELSGEINRKDFGLKWNAVTEAGSIVVADKIKLVMGIQLIKQ